VGGATETIRIDGVTPTAWSWLLALSALALVLRVIALDAPIWIDEVFSLLDTFRMPLGELVTTYRTDNQHPLYAFAARISLVVFGESAWSIRLPAVLFGVASVPALYLLGKEAAGEREGWMAAALLTVSYHHVWFSQNARGYTALAFFSIVGTYALLRGLRSGHRGWFVGYAVIAGLGAYTHLTMVFLAVAQAIVCAVTLWRPPTGWKVRWPNLVIAFVGGAAATLTLYAPVLGQVIAYFTDSPSGMVGVSTRVWALVETLRQLEIGFGAGIGAGLGAAVALACLFGGAWRFARRAPVAFALFAFPGVVVVIGAALARGTMYPRFFFFMAGFALLFLIEGTLWAAETLAHRIPALRGREGALGLAFFAVLLLGSAASLPFNYRLPKQDFDGARDYVEAQRAPGESVYAVGVAVRPLREYLQMPWPEVDDEAQMEAALRDRPSWLIYAMPRITAGTLPEVWALLEPACPDPRSFPGTLGDGTVLVCHLEAGS
jgi:4-amino-4-deoxy-L-arabinose transferase-like glycosyltransferase